MLSVTVTDKDGTSTTSTFDKVEIMIGRLKGGVRPNDIVLRAENVQRHHARIVVKDNRLILIHLNCRETFVNGNKVLKPQLLYDGDKVSIGDFTLEVHKIGESWGPDFS
ncbi:MAG: FHA domain-containing protein [Proteobacteria bacterium]|nr:FHA domain-containing protein [Pseudomonadota bacterium]